MKIAVAQTRPITGDITANVAQHLQMIEEAGMRGTGMIIFPELSIIGYEPALARELATTLTDARFDTLQHLSDHYKLTLGIGAPLLTEKGINIGMAIFSPDMARQAYGKQYLHADEEPYFVSAENNIGLLGPGKDIALAICYEIAVPAHPAAACSSGAKVYIASVAKTAKGVANAHKTLAGIAARYHMITLMANNTGTPDNTVCGGKSAIWNAKGEMLAQLSADTDGMLILDLETMEVQQY